MILKSTMALINKFSSVARNMRVLGQLNRFLSNEGPTGSVPPQKKTPAPPPPPPPQPKGPVASQEVRTDPTKYNVPEYYQHNIFTYYDVDNAMSKFRLEQPSKFETLKPKK